MPDLDAIERRITADHNARLSRAQSLALIARAKAADALEAEMAKLLPLADATTAFVDEQGKRAIREGDEWRIGEPQDFDGEGFSRLVSAVNGAGR